jgi:hypothetical protein
MQALLQVPTSLRLDWLNFESVPATVTQMRDKPICEDHSTSVRLAAMLWRKKSSFPRNQHAAWRRPFKSLGICFVVRGEVKHPLVSSQIALKNL